MAKHIHVHIHTRDDGTAHDPKNGQFTSGSGGSGGGDPAVVNVPLAKRGDINAQLDKYKAQQAAAAKVEAKSATAQRKTDKSAAKELHALHGEAMVKRFEAKFGRKAIVDMLDQMVKWEPKKFIALAEKHAKETGHADS